MGLLNIDDSACYGSNLSLGSTINEFVFSQKLIFQMMRQFNNLHESFLIPPPLSSSTSPRPSNSARRTLSHDSSARNNAAAVGGGNRSQSSHTPQQSGSSTTTKSPRTQLNAYLAALDKKVSLVHATSKEAQRSSKLCSGDLEQVRGQICVLKASVETLSRTMLEEFTQLRHECATNEAKATQQHNASSFCQLKADIA